MNSKENITQISLIIKRILIPLVIILSILFAFTDIICTKWITENEIFDGHSLTNLIDSKDTNEICIFGSSKAKKNYSIKELGENYYNYGMKSANFDVVNLLLSIELEKNKNTPIIIDVNHEFFEIDSKKHIDIITYIPFLNKN